MNLVVVVMRWLFMAQAVRAQVINSGFCPGSVNSMDNFAPKQVNLHNDFFLNN